MKLLLPVTLVLTALALAGCERKTIVIQVPPPTPTPIAEPVEQTKTLETARLGSAIDTYEREASATNAADVKTAFAKLDGEIAELEEFIAKHSGSERAEAAAKLENLQKYRAAETVRFTAAQAKAPLTQPAPVDARTGAEKIEDSARKVGNAIEDAAKDVRDAVKDKAR